MLSSTTKVILFLLISIGTAFNVFFIEKYQNIGEQLLINAEFSKELSNWNTQEPSSSKIVIHQNQLIISSQNAQKSVQVYQKIQTDVKGKTFRLRATLSSKDVISGEKNWNKARLLLVQFISEKAQWNLPHVLASIEGSHDWKIYNGVFHTSSECSKVHIIAQTNRCSGELFVKDLNLYEVEETSLYTWVKWLIRSTWIIFIFALFIPRLGGGSSSILNIFIVLTVAGMVIGTSLPGHIKNDLKKDIIEEVDTYTAPVKMSPELAMNPAHYKFFKLDITKIAHFCLFALLALLLLLKNPSCSIRLILLELLMLACATELMQFYVDGRSPLIADVLIDMAGSVVGGVTGKYLSCPTRV